MVDAGAVDAPPRENAGLEAASPPAEGILNIEGAPLEAGAAAPKAGLGVLSVVVDGVVESAGLGVVPNRPPPGAAEDAPPNIGLLAAAPVFGANKPPDVCDCVAAGVVERPEDAVAFDGAAFIPPNKLGLDAGGGPAGVVELLPNKVLPAGAGVADALAPNKLPVAGLLAPPPNIPLVAGCPDAVDSVVLFGV